MTDEILVTIEGGVQVPLLAEIFALRHEVFVVEQHVPVELEIDELDVRAVHMAALRTDVGGTPELIGTLRVVIDGDHAKIGRVAVRMDARRAGVATQLLEKAVALADERGVVEVCLDAQVDAVPLYARLGFVADGDIFDDAGLEHIRMRKPLRRIGTIMSSMNGHALAQILEKLAEAFFPYYDDMGRFCWDRRETRSMIRLNAATLARADRIMSRIATPFAFTEDRSTDQVIELLGSEDYHKNSWVKGVIVEIYRVLRTHGRLRTIEARLDGELAGAVLGIELGRVFIVETLLTLRSDGSKAALCWAAKKYATLGYSHLDVQRPHAANHPCHRLGEETMPIADYLALLHHTREA